jgi:hypothetical protein
MQNNGLGQNRVGRRNQLKQREEGWTAKSGELGRETQGRTRHNWTGLSMAKRRRDRNNNNISYFHSATNKCTNINYFIVFINIDAFPYTLHPTSYIQLVPLHTTARVTTRL